MAKPQVIHVASLLDINNYGCVITAGTITGKVMEEIFQIEHHCPKCKSITPLLVGIVACIGCGDPLQIIAVELPDEPKKIEDVRPNPPTN